MGLQIRSFRRVDADGVVELWNESMKHDFSEDERHRWYAEESLLSEGDLEEKVRNPSFDPKGFFVAFEGSQIVGFGLGVVKRKADYDGEDLESTPAYFPAIAVHPDLRRKGISKKIFNEIAKYLQGSEKKEVWVHSHSPINFVRGIMKDTGAYHFLSAMGFKPNKPSLLLKLDFRDFRLRDEILDEKRRLEEENIELKYYDARYRDAFSRLAEENFKTWWITSLRPNLMSKEPLPFLIATHENDVVGYVSYVHIARDGRTRLWGGVGVSPEYRVRKIGKVLVNLWAHEVKKKGAKESVIMTGFDNVVAQHIYYDLGYKTLGEICTKWTRRLC